MLKKIARWWRVRARAAYAVYLLTFKGEQIRRWILEAPQLYSARHNGDWLAMSVEYNNRVNQRAFISPDQIRYLMQGVLVSPGATQHGQ